MWARWLADGVVLLHFAFVVFVVLGGFLVVRWRRLAWLHVPCAVWGFLIEVEGWICPLTYLENDLRRRAGQLGYSGSFIEHYLLPVIYPPGLTRSVQIVIGSAVVAVNSPALSSASPSRCSSWSLPHPTVPATVSRLLRSPRPKTLSPGNRTPSMN